MDNKWTFPLFLILLCTALTLPLSQAEANTLPPPETSNLLMNTAGASYYPYHIQIFSKDNPPKEAYTVIHTFKINATFFKKIAQKHLSFELALRQEAAALGGDAVILPADNATKKERNVAEVIIFGKAEAVV
jgi:hypothetical protein